MQINWEEQLGSKTDCATQDSSAVKLTRDIEIKNKLTVTRGEEEGIMGVERTHGQEQRRVRSKVGGGDGRGGGDVGEEMETNVLKQQ